MDELIDAIIWMYGCTKKQAKAWAKEYSNDRKQLILECYHSNIKKFMDQD